MLVLAYTGLMVFVPISKNDSVIVPAITYSVPALLLFILNIFKVRQSHLVFIFSIFVLGLFSIIGTTTLSGVQYWPKIRGLSLLIYSVVCGMGLYLAMASSNRQNISSISWGFMWLILVGASLETFLGLGWISDAFRQKFMLTPYFADERDIDLIGRIRPKFFTSEPSYLAGFFALMSWQWLVASEHKMKNLVFLLLSLISGVIIGSPIVILATMGGFIIYLFSMEAGTGSKIDFRKKSLILILGLGLLTLLGFTTLEKRIENIVSGRGGSFVIRTVSPIYMAQFALEENIIFGIGLSGSEAAMGSVITRGAIASNIPGVEGSKYEKNQNTFFSLWMNFGLFGGILFIVILWSFLKSIDLTKKGTMFLMILVLSQLGLGSIHGVKFWAYLFSFLACIHKLDTKNKTLQNRKTESA